MTINLSYRQGYCASCGTQIWVTDALGRLAMPLPNLREGYLVFDNGARLKIPICETCELDENKDLIQILANLIFGNEALDFSDQTPIVYEKYENHWADKGITVIGIWRRLEGKPFIMNKSINNG